MSSSEDLQASENRLRVILECTKGIVFEFDRHGRYLNIWTHDESLLAAPREQLLGRTIIEVLGEESARLFMDIVQRVFATGRNETFEYELDVQGGRRWFSAEATIPPPIADREPTVVYLVRDITARKELEEQLRQAQKMEAIGQLAGGIAHDFNNILTTITGYSQLLLDGLDDVSAHHEHAARIRHAAERASALTSQLLAYGRKQVLVPEVLDINVVLSSMGHMLRRLIGEHIELVLQLGVDVGGVKVDRSGLEQVIMNLALNARDALDDGGLLTIETANLEGSDYVALIVKDNGRGMDAATKARIFEPFFTTKEVGKGTGLGLSTVYGILKQSGGDIQVESEPGRGASFRALLPRVAPLSKVADTYPDLAPAPPSQLTILVVEDDDDVRELIDCYLMSDGYEVMLAASAAQALELANQRSIDLLITDVVMPKMGGDALATKLRTLQPEIRVLYISGYPDDPRGTRVPRVENSLFLQKPFTRQELEKEVGALFVVR